MITNNDFYHYRQIRSLQSTDDKDNNIINLNLSSINGNYTSSNICSTQSINIDSLVNRTDSNSNIQHSTSITINIIDINHFISSWQQEVITNDDENEDDHATSLNTIQIIFTIPYKISNESILNKTIFITDVTHHQLLASLTNICINGSSFIINYSTIKSLPQNICLYLLLNLTSSTTLKEIIFCRTIDDLYTNTSSSQDSNTATSQATGPSGIFILSQCIIILIMMFIIYGVQTAREKSLVNRVRKRLIRSRPYITIFGNKTAVNISTNAATTLQVGLNHLAFHRHLQSSSAQIEEQVLAANDLTSTINDRRISRPIINRDLIDVKEFTKRMSVTNEASTDAELQAL